MIHRTGRSELLTRIRTLALVVLASTLVGSCVASGDLLAPIPTPAITSISPNSGVVGTSVNVTVIGTNFVLSGASVTPVGDGITVSNVNVTSPTSFTATLAIAPTASLGAHGVTIATAGGTSTSAPFTVLPLAPTLTSLSPDVGIQGTNQNVVLTGSNFLPGATTVLVDGAGITTSNVVFTSSTSITATFAIAAGATLGAHNVTATTAGGSTGSRQFSVIPPAPTLTGLSPITGVTGTTQTVTLTGTNFVAGNTSVLVSGAGVTVTAVTVVNPSTMTASFIVATGAALGDRDVTVTTGGGTSASRIFTIIPPPPTLSGVFPSTVAQGAATLVTLTGTNFVAGATTVTIDGFGVTINSVNVSNATTLTASFSASAAAPVGVRNVRVATAGGTSGTAGFAVVPGTPTITSITPRSGVVGTAVPVTIIGTNFAGGATVVVDGIGVTVSSVTVTGTTSLSAIFTVDAGATLGAHGVTVTTSAGTSAAGTFSVTPAAPTLVTVSPGGGLQNSTVAVSLTGTNFINGATTVSVDGVGIAVQTVAVTGPTTLTASFVIAANATAGAHNVTVTTPGGTSGAQPFVVNPPFPDLTAIAPNGAVQGTSVGVTLTGSGFVTGGSTVAVDGTGVTVSNVVVNSATSITATFTLASDATLGGRNVSVTTAGGTSAAVTFTVNPTSSALVGISPDVGYRGTTLPVSFDGVNFVSGNTGINVSGIGVTVDSIVVNSATSMGARFTIDAGAPLGGRSVTVTTPAGTSNAVNFDVLPPPPTLASVTPNTVTRGTNATVTLTGTNFVNASTVVVVDGSGVTVNGVTFNSSTSLTVSLTISAGATLGGHNVTVTTFGGGTSNAVVLTVNP
ncbi:MAG: IPT/TIG domain-containing protein [Gemmatimonadota bacterium]